MHRKTRRIQRHARRLSGHWRVRLIFWLGAVAVGVLAAVFASGALFADRLFASGVERWPWLPFVLTPLGLGLVAWLTARFVPQAQGSGIPQTIAALRSPPGCRLRESLLHIKVGLSKIVLTLLGLACGASVGCGGPAAHMGATVMYGLGRLARFPGYYLNRGLIAAGGAAGVAAAFNAPLAGVMFAIEELSRAYDRRMGLVVLVPVILAGVAALLLFGNRDYFVAVDARLDDLAESWPVILGCGVLGGACGGLFARALLAGCRFMAPLQRKIPVRVALVCGLLLALIGLASDGGVYGTGHREAQAILSGEGPVDPLYPLWKLLATLASVLSGIPGGLFAPSFSVGAGFGAAMGEIFTSVPLTAVALLGMAGYFSGVVQTPVTAFVIVMETTNSQELMIPLMVTSLLAAGVSRLICPRPIYVVMAVGVTALFEARGENAGPQGAQRKT